VGTLLSDRLVCASYGDPFIEDIPAPVPKEFTLNFAGLEVHDAIRRLQITLANPTIGGFSILCAQKGKGRVNKTATIKKQIMKTLNE
jgi:hypothetical protein